tara:strand:- start:333 stop:851 length:519 start_codon:yes stop_codon:yes gene_type:complete
MIIPGKVVFSNFLEKGMTCRPNVTSYIIIHSLVSSVTTLCHKLDNLLLAYYKKAALKTPKSFYSLQPVRPYRVVQYKTADSALVKFVCSLPKEYSTHTKITTTQKLVFFDQFGKAVVDLPKLRLGEVTALAVEPDPYNFKISFDRTLVGVNLSLKGVTYFATKVPVSRNYSV